MYLIGRLFHYRQIRKRATDHIFTANYLGADGGAVASVTERKFNQMRVLQLVIDKNGTIKQLP
jgi:general secretion pathway protein D